MDELVSNPHSLSPEEIDDGFLVQGSGRQIRDLPAKSHNLAQLNPPQSPYWSSTVNSFLLSDMDLSFVSSPQSTFEEDSYTMLGSGELMSNQNYTNGTFDNGGPNLSTIHFSIAFQVVIYIIYNMVFVAALLGNILVCYVVFSSPRMRTVTNYLIANLAVGDLLMALLCVPFSYISLLLQYWPFGEVLCHVVAPAQAVCVFVSAYTLVALAGDRYGAILYPLRPRLRRSQAIIVILIVWVIAIITSMPIAVFTKLKYNEESGLPECSEDWTSVLKYRLIYSLTLMILQYFFPLAVLIFTYTRIALAVWGKKAPGEAEDGRDQRLAKAKRKSRGVELMYICMLCWLWLSSGFKMIKMMLAVVIVYTVSWLPFNTLIVYSDLDETIWESNLIRHAFPIIQWLALAHCVLNPVIYCLMNSRFREGFHSAISNVPFLKKVTNFGRQSQQEFRLNRMNTYTTYTFVSGNGGLGKMERNSSLLTNGRHGGVAGGSPVSIPRSHSDAAAERDRLRLNRNSAGGGGGTSGSGHSVQVTYPVGNRKENGVSTRVSNGKYYSAGSVRGGKKSSQKNEESFM